MTCFRISKYILTFNLLTLVQLAYIANSTYYRGGTISWKANNTNDVEFHIRMSWKYGSNGCLGNSSSGNFVTSLSGEKWRCSTGCVGTPVVGDNSYNCIRANETEGWELGEKKFTYKLNSTAKNQFTIGYEAGKWMRLGYGTGGNWKIQTKVDPRTRNDTAKPNNSPVTSAMPIYRLQNGCSKSISIPIHDVDNDATKCRWAINGECGDMCDNVTKTLPNAILNPQPCELTINATSVNGYSVGSFYLVALTIEDFPTSLIYLDNVSIPTTQPLSSIPLQFLVFVENATASCNSHLLFTGTPPDGQEFIVPTSGSWSQRIYVQSTSGNMPSTMRLSGPQGLTVSAFKPDDLGRPSTMYADMTWTPSLAMNGINMVCFIAEDDFGSQSEQRCFVLLTGYPDPCLSNPCKNGGQCDISFTSFICTCPKGVYGTFCEHDIDECKQAPCENGGQCFNRIGDYTCFCRPGFAGKNCSDADYCSSNPCQGQGDCVHNVTLSSFSCDCYHGYSGKTCQIDEDDCTSDPCMNGAKCIDLVGGYNCECPPKYTGQNCEDEIDFCDPNPCQNGGACRRLKNDYVCNCHDDVIGLNCEISIEQMCNGDQSYCTCHVNGEPVRVPIPDPVNDETYERDLRSGVIGYPVGLLIGIGCCALFHYAVRPRCSRQNNVSEKRKMSSASSFLSSSRTSVHPARVTPPPRYSTLDLVAESNI